MFMLNEIIENKKMELDQKKRQQSLEFLKAKLSGVRAVRDFHSALTAKTQGFRS